MTNYIPEKETRHVDMRPKVTERLHDEILRRATLLGIPKNTYLAMMIQAASQLPPELLFETINDEIRNGRA
ncbi:MAG: hypothetical protein JKY67_08390 [Pseudomonadales bacterium]|nr:hypothetical protein [Pseudomonadales bacterium]